MPIGGAITSLWAFHWVCYGIHGGINATGSDSARVASKWAQHGLGPLVDSRREKVGKTMDKTTGIPNRGMTHAGVFHADDVFATAFLRMLNPSIDIVRQNAVPEGFEGIVYDVGGGEFDHHQGEAKVRDNGVPFSSFGLLWNRFGTMLLQEEDAESLDRDLVQPIDLTDNTGEGNPLSLCVSDFNPLHMATFPEFDAAFWKAVDWAQDVLERRVASLRASREQCDYVCGLAREGDGRVLVLDHLVRWKQALVGSGYVYVVYPSLRGGFNVQCVPQRLGDGSMVHPFPEAWRGKSAEELRELTGVSDVVFCHAAGFLCAAESLDGALALAEHAMGREL